MKAIIRIVVSTVVLLTLLLLSIKGRNFDPQTEESKSRGLIQSSSLKDRFPDSQHVSDLSELTVKILQIGPSTPPEDIIPSPKYKIHLWFEASYSTEVLVVTQHNSNQNPKDNIFANKKISPSTAKRDKLIIMFRGSEDWEDWVSNINIGMDEAKFETSPSNVKVHRGFQNNLFQENIPAQLEEKIFSLLNDTTLNLTPNNVVLSGHSLGGVLAHMMGIHLAEKYNDFNVDVVTFGEPRFGNKALKQWVKSSLPNLVAWRFVYRKDFVPRIVPRILGYSHTGHLYRITDFGSSVYYDQTGGEGKYIGAPRKWYGKLFAYLRVDFFRLVYSQPIG